jgi:hypothetical protein
MVVGPLACRSRHSTKCSREKWRSAVISATVRQGLGMAMKSYSYSYILLNQPWETWNSGRIILSYQLDSDSPGTWITRMMLTPFCRQPARRVQGSSHQLCQKTLQPDQILVNKYKMPRAKSELESENESGEPDFTSMDALLWGPWL